MKKIILILLLASFAASCSKNDNGNPTQYMVSYDGNGNTGGSAPIDANKYKSGSQATIIGNTSNLAKTGFSFIGWNSSSSGNGTDYAPGSTLNIGSSSITLYAKWHDNSTGSTYSITYDGNGNNVGNPPVDNTSYVNGSGIVVLGNTGGLSKNGSDFQGWNTSPGGNGSQYNKGDIITVQNSNITLYAIYQTAGSGQFVGFDISGEVATKSSLTSSWITQDVNDHFGANVVAVTWNGSQYVGFDIAGEVATKSSLTSSWVTQDANDHFGANVVAVTWDGSRYVGFDISGEVATKSSLTSSWITQDVNDHFGANVVAVTWNGSQYVGFDIAGEVATKSSLTSSWITQDTNDHFGANVVAVTWDGSRYVGVDISGEVATKSSLTSSWITQDTNDHFGANIVAIVYN